MENKQEKYLNFIIKDIVRDTQIYRSDVGGIKIQYPWVKYSMGIDNYWLKHQYAPSAYWEYCRDKYALSEDEVADTWIRVVKELNNKVSNFSKNLNETTERYKKNMIKYLDYIKSDMRSGVSFNGKHFYLFGCNISVHLNHNDYPPYFAWVPSCFKEVVKNNYDLPDDMITDLWYDWFGDYIRDQYMTMKRLR